jgi:hypothetical protein
LLAAFGEHAASLSHQPAPMALPCRILSIGPGVTNFCPVLRRCHIGRQGTQLAKSLKVLV